MPLYPEPDAPNPLRNEILAGRPILALANDALEGAIVEAARVSGRLADVRIVASDPRYVPALFDGGALTLLPPLDMLEQARPGRRTSPRTEDPTLARFGEAGLPDWERVIFVARIAGGSMVASNVFRAAERLSRIEARANGRLPPASFWARPVPDRSMENRPTLDFRLGKRTYRLAGDPEVLRCAQEDRNWAAALKGFRRQGLKAHQGATLSAMMSDDRLVAVHVRTNGRQGGAVTRVYQVDGHGVLSGLEIDAAPAKEEALHFLAEQAFLGGLEQVRGLDLQEIMLTERARLRELRMGLAMHSIFRPQGVDAPDESLANLRGIIGLRMDVEIADILCHGPHPEIVTRLVAQDPTKAAVRKEFCRTWPGFAGLLLEEGVREVVDARGETLPAMAARLGVSRPIARRLVGRKSMPGLMRLAAGQQAESQYAPAILFGSLGHDRLPPPGDKAEWAGFCKVAAAVKVILGRSLANVSRVPIHEVTALMTGGPEKGWAARAEAVKRVARTSDELGDIADMTVALSQWLNDLGMPADTALAFRVMARHGTLARMHAASVRWHDAPLLQGGGRADADGKDIPWPVPFDAVDLGDGWTAVPLDRSSALRAEGRRGEDSDGMAGLGHCVGGYDRRCRTGESLIVSLRHATAEGTRRVSTAELKPGVGGDWRIGDRDYVLAQHRARGNAVPDTEARSRLSRLSYLLADGSVPIREEPLEPREIPQPRQPTREEAVALHAVWRPMFPETVRNLDLDGLRDFLSTMEGGLEPPNERDLERVEALHRQGRRNRDRLGRPGRNEGAIRNFIP